ncbi:fatty acid hydroxylase [Tumebacillus algifaecis]|uniref:Fatty acid hydroxylase n=1 Tax=Tumebacillus algifaecis TaxID=1214604 RepID=A0A223D6W9_9BACL|nr:sterol desaturase family protein [Tumebacillus algifaecis]ASS77237.1 fatty acid hydroxylase [Tumebacillus algifaecis]
MGLIFLYCLAFVALKGGLAAGSVWLLLVLGAGIFFVSEYTTHRFLFHRKPPKNPTLLKMMRKLHYDHHEVPNELDLLFLPVWYSIPNYSLLGLFTYWLTGDLLTAHAVVSGAIGALLYYEWVHFVAHRPIKPLTAWGRWMKKVHLWHHYKNENYWFGVSNPSIDYLLGTFQNEKGVELSPTARKLQG